MLAGSDVVLIAVPRADDVQLVREVVAEAPLLVVESLDDAVHQRALADRSSEVRTPVLPCVQLTVQAEDSDLESRDVDDHTAAFENIFGQRCNYRLAHTRNILLRDPGVNLTSVQITGG